MPRPSRGSELPQRQSPRLRTSSTSSESHLHHRPTTDRSPKLGLDRRSPRSGGPHSDPLNQKKLGTRIADLESQLGQAQDELRVLKDQLATAEAAKKQAQEELQNKSKKPKPPAQVEGAGAEAKRTNQSDSRDEVRGGDSLQETDVFEVPVEKIAIEPNNEPQKEAKEAEKPKFDELASNQEEINMLKAKLYDMEKEQELLGKENESLKNQLNHAASEAHNAKAKEEETTARMNQIEKELEESKATAAELKLKLGSAGEAKEALEAEMKTLRVQTEQWRKAADAAAAVLAGGVEMNSRGSERCGSMEKHLVGGFLDPTAVGGGGYVGTVGSPGMADDSDDGLGSGKRKGSGIKKLGDLWRKKGQK